MLGCRSETSSLSRSMKDCIGTVCLASIMNRVPMSQIWMTSGVDLLWIAALYLVIASSYLPEFFRLNSVTSLVSSSAFLPSMECQKDTVVTPLAFDRASLAGAPAVPPASLPPPQAASTSDRDAMAAGTAYRGPAPRREVRGELNTSWSPSGS